MAEAGLPLTAWHMFHLCRDNLTGPLSCQALLAKPVGACPCGVCPSVPTQFGQSQETLLSLCCSLECYCLEVLLLCNLSCLASRDLCCMSCSTAQAIACAASAQPADWHQWVSPDVRRLQSDCVQTLCADPPCRPRPCCCRWGPAGARAVEQRLRCQRGGQAGLRLNSLPAGATGVPRHWPGGECEGLVWLAGRIQTSTSPIFRHCSAPGSSSCSVCGAAVPNWVSCRHQQAMGS